MSSPTQVAVTATLNDPSGSALQGNSFVRFILRNFQGYIPQITGTSIIAETQIDSLPNSNGWVSQQLWGNNNITPDTTFYEVQYWDQGRITSRGNYLINGGTDLTTASQLNTPPVPPGFDLVLQNNGADNSSQSTLNLQAGAGIILADEGAGTIEITSQGSVFSTAGSGFFWGPGLIEPPFGGIASESSSVTLSTTDLDVLATEFLLESEWTIRKVTTILNGSVSGTANFGIYSSAGALLLDAGGFSAESASVQSNTLSTPVVLSPGTYFFAQGSTNTSAQAIGIGSAGTELGPLLKIWNFNSNRQGIAANPMASGGGMPLTLGAITVNTSFGLATPLFEV